MKFKICYSYDGEWSGTDSFIVEGNMIPEIQEKVKSELEKRNIPEENAWSEQLED